MKTNMLRDAIKFALAVGATAAVGTGVAFAQEPTAPAEQETTTLDRIQVTGSRISRVEVETSLPIFTLNREDIQAQGLTSIGDVIQNLSGNGSTLNSTFNNGGNGETRVSLRNLGSARTLVLVNGRRWVGGNGLGGAVDLTTIPTAMVERIEVLKDGASTIYGSDAIAGVVNIILRSDYQGAEANAYIGNFDEGDGFRQSYDVIMGAADDRFSAVFGASYVKEEPVWAGDREISAEPIVGTGTSFGSSTSPDGRFALCPIGAPTVLLDPVNGSCTRLSPTVDNPTRRVNAEVRPDGSTGQFTFNPGQTADDWRNFLIPEDIYNFAPDNYLLTPQERISIFGRGTLALTDDVSFFAQGTYSNRKSEQLLAAMPIVLGSGPGAGVQSRTVNISPDSFYNPFGTPVSRIQRRAVETGGRSFLQNVDTYMFTGGLEGSFEVGERFFSWDAGMQYGRNDRNDTTFGLFNVPALRSALGPSFQDGPGGQILCGTPDNPATAVDERNVVQGCVPLNLLGGVGSITQEMLDFVSFVAHDEFGYEMKQYFANISGDIVELPGGMMAFAAGVERREESGFDQPDALINSGNTTGNARTATNGSFDVEEAYLELAIPLLSDVPFAKELEFSVATRYSDYSNFGDTLNSKFGFKWRPIEQLLIRGNWAEGFRAPSIGELFSGVSDSFPQIADPCSTTFGGGYNSLNAAQQARCTAQGVPVGGYDQGNSQIRISTGGNPNLVPELSTSKTLGVVWNPEFIEGFDISLDWWNIKLVDTINAFGGQTILNRCIRDGEDAFCTLFSRGTGGSIDTLLSAGLNFGSTEVEGYDMTVNYRMPETSWGRLSFVWDSTYMTNYEINNDGDNLVGEYFDRNNFWRIRSNLLTRWELGDFGATWGARFYSKQDEDCQFMVDYGFLGFCSDEDRFIDDADGNPIQAAQNRLGGTTYHDVSVYWKAPWNARITVGVNNAGDKDPPVSFSTFANSFDPQYEVPGRFYYLQYNQKF